MRAEPSNTSNGLRMSALHSTSDTRIIHSDVRAVRQADALKTRAIITSLAQAAEHLHDATSQKRGQHHVDYDYRPQKDAGRNTCETEIRKIQRDQCAIGPHADERRTRPAGDP